jgi:hypothetical protein
MADRARLHKLVDELPEAALDAAYRVLDNYQKWPPKGPADANKMLNQARERFRSNYEKRAQLRAGGYISSEMIRSSFGPEGYGYSSVRGWEGLTSVTAAAHYFRGYEFHTVERISLSDDNREIQISIESKLPGGIAESHEISFDISEGGSNAS